MQFGDDDVLEDVDPSAGHKQFCSEESCLFFLFGEFDEVVECAFEGEKGDVKFAGGCRVAVTDDLAGEFLCQVGDFYVHYAGEFYGEGEFLRGDFESRLYVFGLH